METMILMGVLIMVYLIIRSKSERAELTCPNCKKEGGVEVMMKLDESSNYLLPEAGSGYRHTLYRHRCQHCKYTWDVIKEESNN